MQNGINGGPVSLAMTNQDIINKLLDHLHHYLMSHQEMLISNSFKLSMKVLSQHHMRLRGLIGMLQDTLGTMQKARKKVFILPTPVGFKDCENAFFGQCAIVSCILAKGYNSYFSEDNSDFPYRDIANFIHGNILKVKKVGWWILAKLRHFLESKNVQQDINGYTSDINKKLQQYFNCQIHIFCKKSSNFKVASYPAIYNPEMEQIYIEQIEEAFGENIHYQAITNINQFYTSVKRRYCFDCGGIIKSDLKNWRHSCTRRKTCLACRRLCYSEDFWCLPKDKVKTFCDQREMKIFDSCHVCKVDFYSNDCKENHRRSECRRGIKCLKCTKYISICSKRRNQEEALSKHVCGETKCSECYEITTSEHHICSMKKQTSQKNWTKVSFLLLSFLKNEYNQSVPAQACLVYEHKKPGNFLVKMFHGTKKIIEKPGFQNIYWPTEVERNLNENGIRGNFGKYKRLPNYLNENDISFYENVTKKVLKHIFDQKESFQNTTFVMPTYSDLLAIISALVDLKLYPSVLRKDNKILSVTPKDINIRFVCYLNFQAVSAKCNEGIFFPHNLQLNDLHKPDILLNYNDLKDFNDSATIKLAKTRYIDSLTSNYSFEIEGLDFLYNSAIALATSCLLYIKDSFDFQNELIHHLIASSLRPANDTSLLNPLSTPFVSNGAFIYGVFRLYVLNGFEIGCIPKENIGLSNNKVSQGEAQFVYWLNRNANFRAFYNHIDGQTREFKILYPDAFDKDTNTAYFYNGCYIHNHSKNQCQNKGKQIKRKIFLDDNESFEAKRQKFEENYPNINVKIKWECEWKKDLKEKDVKEWFDKNPCAKDPPLNRLIPRDAVRGGTSETYNFLWSKIRNPDETLVYADVTSQYPDIALKYDFPIGNFEVIIGKELKEIVVSEDTLVFRNQQLYGLIFLSIEAPKDLEFPFLSHRIKDSISVAALCKTCAKDQTLSICNHKGMQKFITGNYTTQEINYALSLGYKIQQIYEVWHWAKKAPIYKTFMQLLLRKKVMYSGFPDDHKTESEKEAYCSSVNRKLNLKGSLALETKDIVYDKRLKDYFKFLTVSAVGKVGQGNLFPSDVFACNNDTVNKYFYNDDGSVSDSITDLELINNDTLYLRVKPSKETAVTNRTGNCVIQAMITAQARIDMHKTLLSVVNAGCKVFSLEADAIVFSHKTKNHCPITLGNQVGEFKEEYKNIQSYSTLGPKTSNVTYLDGQTKRNVVKIKGLNLTGEIAAGSVSNEIYEQQVIDLLHGIQKKVIVLQKRTHTTFASSMESSVLQEYTFSNWIMKNRKLFWDNIKGMHTLPYGYNC